MLVPVCALLLRCSLDRHNQSLTRENSRLKTQFKSQEEDREYLIRQLVAVKRDNARLRQEVVRTREDLDKVQRIADDQVLDPSPLPAPV